MKTATTSRASLRVRLEGLRSEGMMRKEGLWFETLR